MRTIKFRGKDAENGMWIYGDLFQRIGFYPQIIEYFADDNGKLAYRGIAVQENTVGQFTGLHDKDGKEIYEDDIVEFVDINLPDCVIVYDNGSFMYRELGEDISTEELRIQFTVEVIGNIHDNPELLKNND